ncbi:MAG: aminoacyl-tRNA hydrolase [Pseudohongiellaceae bacterium]|jgi:PTH1 family peptidyl-tRNA hydrolase
MSGIKLIVGLGNPGQQYRFTRHNAGAMFLETLCDDYQGELKAENKFFGLSGRIDINGEDIRLLFPSTYMNNSGQAVAAIASYFKIEPLDILVAYDELDLPVGTTRLKKGGGHGGHNGLRDIIKALGSQDFNRLRIGIGHPGEASKVSNYVLSEPSKADADQIQADIDKSIAILPLLVKGEFQEAMLKLHTQPQDSNKKEAEDGN